MFFYQCRYYHTLFWCSLLWFRLIGGSFVFLDVGPSILFFEIHVSFGCFGLFMIDRVTSSWWLVSSFSMVERCSFSNLVSDSKTCIAKSYSLDMSMRRKIPPPQALSSTCFFGVAWFCIKPYSMVLHVVLFTKEIVNVSSILFLHKLLWFSIWNLNLPSIEHGTNHWHRFRFCSISFLFK